jgi:hypothetical protein
VAVRSLALTIAAGLRDDYSRLVARDSQQARAGAEVAVLRAERAQLVAAVGQLGVSLAKGVMDDDGYGAAVGLLRAELSTVEGRLHVVTGLSVVASRPVKELENAAERLRDFWDVLGPQESRAALRLLVPRVLLRRAGYRGEPVAVRLTVPVEEA